MAHVMNAARAFLRLEAAIKYRQVFILHAGRAFNGPRGINVANDGVDLVTRVAELPQRQRHGVVDNLDHASAHKLLVLDERQIRLNAGGVTIHHEADGSSRGKHGDLRVAIANFFAKGQSFIPALFTAFKKMVRNTLTADLVDRSTVHADHIQERLLVYIPAGASSAGNVLR